MLDHYSDARYDDFAPPPLGCGLDYFTPLPRRRMDLRTIRNDARGVAGSILLRLDGRVALAWRYPYQATTPAGLAEQHAYIAALIRDHDDWPRHLTALLHRRFAH